MSRSLPLPFCCAQLVSKSPPCRGDGGGFSSAGAQALIGTLLHMGTVDSYKWNYRTWWSQNSLSIFPTDCLSCERVANMTKNIFIRIPYCSFNSSVGAVVMFLDRLAEKISIFSTMLTTLIP